MAASRSSKSPRSWRWRTGYRVPAKFAAPLGQIIEHVRDAVGENFHAREIVKRARPKASPIHALFEWDDSRAGTKWREQQARVHMANLSMEIETPDGRREMPVVVSVGPGLGYSDTEVVLNSETMRAATLARFLAEFNGLRRRYGHMKELAEVYAAVDRIGGSGIGRAEGDQPQPSV